MNLAIHNFRAGGSDKCFRTCQKKANSESGDIRGDQSGKTGSCGVTWWPQEMSMEWSSALGTASEPITSRGASTASTLTPSPGSSHPLQHERRTLACEAQRGILSVRCWKYDQSSRATEIHNIVCFNSWALWLLTLKATHVYSKCLERWEKSAVPTQVGLVTLHVFWPLAIAAFSFYPKDARHPEPNINKSKQPVAAVANFRLGFPTQANRSRSAWSSCDAEVVMAAYGHSTIIM